MKSIKSQNKNWRSLARAYICEFGELTTLHGIRYILSDKLHVHFSERIFWLIVVVSSAIAASLLIHNSYTRYSANPTVISMEKNFRDWYSPFPAVTICFLDRLNQTAAEEFIFEKWNVKKNSSEFALYEKFLGSLTNLTYNNLHEFEAYENNKELTSIKGEEFVNIVRRVMIQYTEGTTKIFSDANLTFVETLTETGFCFSYAGVITNLISAAKNPPVVRSALPKCNILNSICYGKTAGIIYGIRLYVHSPYEIPDHSSAYYVVILLHERHIFVSTSMTVASKNLRRLQPRQRQCRFEDEPVGQDRAYTYNICRMNCRKKLALKFCGCVPYFYLKQKGEAVCGVKGLACLAKHTSQILYDIDETTMRLKCDCLPQCESHEYYPIKETLLVWSFPIPPRVDFRWSVDYFSRTRYRRDIIFSLEDLLVSLGGTAALFLGCSVISFAEIAYFLTLRLFWYIMKNR